MRNFLPDSPLPTKTERFAVGSHRIVPEDHFKLASLDLPTISPDGGRVAYGDARWGEGKRHHQLRVVNINTRKTRQLTSTPTRFFAPQWSPDGKTIYYAVEDLEDDSNRQVWSIEEDGSKPELITSTPGGISRFVVGASGESLFFTTHTDAPLGEWADLKKPFNDAVTFGAGARQRSKLWQLDLESGQVSLLLDTTRYVTSFSVSPDETRIALATAPDQRLITNEGQSTLKIFNTRSGQIQRLPDELWRRDAPSPYSWIEVPAWSPDSRRIAFRVGFDGFASELILADINDGEPVLRRIPRPLECHPHQLAWHPDSNQLIISAFHRAAIVLATIPVDEPEAYEFLLDGDVVVDAFSVSPRTGGIAFLKSSPTTLPEIHFLTPDKRDKALTNVHSHTNNWKFPRLSRLQWTAPDNTSIEGTLELPPDYDPASGPLPTLVILHGGPSYSALMERCFGIRGHTAFAAQGYAVFSPNFRGSTGYGDDFLHDLVGRTNQVDVADILSGVDALIEAGIADGDRLGMMGWSYGGYLVNGLLATNRFRAASTGAGALEMVGQFAAMDTPGHTLNLLGCFPWEDPEEYRRASPLYSLKDGTRTATLIHSGSDDPRVPNFHAVALHRILHDYFGAPCELLTYRSAGHALESFEHQRARLAWDHAWFKKYMA